MQDQSLCLFWIFLLLYNLQRLCVLNTKNESGITTLAKKGLAQRNRPKAAKIIATEVQRVRLCILLRKGSAKIKQIWLISFPENTQAVS